MVRGIVILALFLGLSTALELKNRAYEDLVIKVAETVPEKECKRVLENLQTSLTTASQYLFSALDSRAYLRSATVLLPPTWPDSCAPSAVISASGETSDVTLVPRGPSRGAIWTQQSLGCGQPGDQIYLSYESLLKRDNALGRSFVKEFAMYRYGVFEEQGYENDPIYPLCYHDDQTKSPKVTGCSDLAIKDNGICTGDKTATYNASQMVDQNARTSIMFAPEAPSVSMFCDDGTHDRFAPTKHNLMCQGKSILDVVLNHSDFNSNNVESNKNTQQLTDTTPRIVYKRQKLTRYVFVIENTKDMNVRESWNFMRLALKFWSQHLPNNTEIGLVVTDDVSSVKKAELTPASTTNEAFSLIPYSSTESSKAGCISCGLRDALEMLAYRTKVNGAAQNVIVLIAAGMNPDPETDRLVHDIQKAKIKIATINYPTIVRRKSLDSLAKRTNGVAYSVFEQKQNVDQTFLTTYFELHNVLYEINRQFYSGSESDLPVEIHRHEILDERGARKTGNFMLDQNMGQPAQFTFFTYNINNPLMRNLNLTSPSHKVYTSRNEQNLLYKMISLPANISETGSWTYSVEPYAGNPQPHFIQMMATPKSIYLPVLRAKFWTARSQPGGPLVLLAEVKYGDMPVMAAKVEVTVTKPSVNGSLAHKNKLELLDNGSGDPDITKGDGVYTRYFSAAEWGPGFYTFEVNVSDNGNTAYTWTDAPKTPENKPCCGSVVPTSGVQPMSPFARILQKQTMEITSEDIITSSQIPAGRIGDLRAQLTNEDMRVRLVWTSPDMGGHLVSRYEVRFTRNIADIVDNFETVAKAWDGQPFPLSPGSEASYTLDLSSNRDFLDTPLYFAIKAYPRMSSDVPGTVSNWVRVFVKSPPVPTTFAPNFIDHRDSDAYDHSGPAVAKTLSFGLELILPIVIGFILLVVLLVVYCYFCVVKRKERHETKSMKSDKHNSNITIVPSSPQHQISTPNYSTDIPDPHVIGVPINNYGYDTMDEKKRFSLVNHQEQQLIEELKQQQNMRSNEGQYGVSVICNGAPRPNGGHTLSPYTTWSASQLLHEHERRHSPLDQMNGDDHHDFSQMDHMSMNGQSMDHMSLNGHMMLPPMMEYVTNAPPVPPLPAFNSNGYPVNYNIYGVHQGPPQVQQMYQSMPRNEQMNGGPQFNGSLQGSLSSVNSGEKKRRNVTMV